MVRAECKLEVVEQKGGPLNPAYQRWLWRILAMAYGVLYAVVVSWTAVKLISVAGLAMFVAIRLFMAPLEAAAMTTALTDGDGLAWKLSAAVAWAAIGIFLEGQLSLTVDACRKRAIGDLSRPVKHFGFGQREGKLKADMPTSYPARTTG